MPREFGRCEIDILAPAKLNLSLRIVGARADGYHLIESIVVPVDLYDRLTVSVSPAEHSLIEFQSSGMDLGVTEEENLVVRAARLFLKHFRLSACIRLVLQKEIPVGAGLGGGSSDAAAVLSCLWKVLDRNPLSRSLSGQNLTQLAAELGADVPFFLESRPARLSGIGENVDPLASWPDWKFVVVFPWVSLATVDVYRYYDASLTKLDGESSVPISAFDRTSPHALMVNDLENAALRIFPGLQMIKERLFEEGARAAMMTGSGSAVFGIWETAADARAAARRINRRGFWARAVSILMERPRLVVRNVGRSPSW
jgi:4-diphosphocytidyl-2-C-methyl-D-erythritol kinase